MAELSASVVGVVVGLGFVTAWVWGCATWCVVVLAVWPVEGA
jgi:hypothetical protein